MLALRSCAYSMYTCIYAVANITIDPLSEHEAEVDRSDSEDLETVIYFRRLMSVQFISTRTPRVHPLCTSNMRMRCYS